MFLLLHILYCNTSDSFKLLGVDRKGATKEGGKKKTKQKKLHYGTTALKDLTESGTCNPARHWDKLSETEILSFI